MKKIYITLLIFIGFGMETTVTSQTNSVTLTPAAGVPVFYPSITSAYAAIPSGSGVSYLLELLPTYNGTDPSEIYPILFSSKGLTPGGPITITIRPAINNPAAIIQRATPTFLPVVSFDDGDNVILDGRPGGVTTGIPANYLTVNQPFTTAVALPAGSLFRNIDFVNSANNNIVRFVNAAAAPGTSITGAQNIVIGSTTSTGNNNNSILNCVVSGAVRGIQDFGLSATVPNNGTIIRNNTVKDYSSIGIFVGVQTNVIIQFNTLQVTGTVPFGTSVEGIRQQATVGTGSITDNNILLTPTSTNVASVTGIVNSGSGTEVILRNRITGISAPAATALRGISITNTGGAAVTVNVSRNLVTNMSGAASTSTIAISSGGSATMTYSQDTLTNLSGQTSVQGFSVSSTVASTISLSANMISNFTATGAGNLRGIAIFPFTNSVINTQNNFISLTLPNAGAAAIFGILAGNTAGRNYTSNIYYNSIRIGGTTNTSPTAFTGFGIYKSDANGASIYNQKNNIVLMERDGAAFEFASNLGTLSIDYNTYYASGTNNSFAVETATADYTNSAADLALYKTAVSPQEQNTNFTNVTFVSNTDLHLAGASITDPALIGTPVAGITTDIDGNTRSATAPFRGGDEPVSVVSVNLLTFTGRFAGNKSELEWRTASEANNRGFELQRSADGRNFTAVSFTNTKAIGGNSAVALDYGYTDLNPLAVSYYRLKQQNIDGAFRFSNILVIKGKGSADLEIVNIYPNPVTEKFTLITASTLAGNLIVSVIDMNGKRILQRTVTSISGMNNIEINSSAFVSGSYIIQVLNQATGKTASLKFSK